MEKRKRERKDLRITPGRPLNPDRKQTTHTHTDDTGRRDGTKEEDRISPKDQ